MDTRVSKFIKKYREACKLTTTELGALLGVSQATVALWENNKRFPRLRLLQNAKNLFEKRLGYKLELNLLDQEPLNITNGGEHNVDR